MMYMHYVIYKHNIHVCTASAGAEYNAFVLPFIRPKQVFIKETNIFHLLQKFLDLSVTYKIRNCRY